ncbi:uncharacterized protein M421DRAFT_78461 [Didymella exigua CBS 183.55]|uniref:Uncharacterized protein n=1 Tax=Didymella exigua CBS 183.55 TaxID=1150837 RepID=A0A6A5R6L8_9PLEO|nr:uncharacterized protein M421DRAFT_78461 [Didymella exigua CBS 183.55]KAF1922376.1 hypothetical protein M421DRAFT_78461 [Didymella exigua CBS 183.55]
MPIPVPPGALPEAHRVICIRSVRAAARGRFVDFEFSSMSSKKCAYCTFQNEKCVPLPTYVESEFSVFWQALGQYEVALGSDVIHDRHITEARVRAAAFALASCVQVATAQLKSVLVVDVLLADYYRVAEENRVLQVQMADLAAAVEKVAGAQVELTKALQGLVEGGSRGGKRQRGGRGGRPSGGRGNRYDGGLRGEVGAESDSELSDVPHELSGDEMNLP